MTSVYRQDIQSLRGICVMSVVLFHMFPELFKSGYLGVDIFFTISGYVLAPQFLKILTEENRTRAYLLFVKLRFWRLFPAFITTITFSLLALFFLAQPNIHKRALNQVVYSLVQLGDLGAFKFSGNYFDTSPNPFLHFWSLSVEWQFYLLFPIVTIFCTFFFKSNSPRTLFLFFVVVLTSSLIIWFSQNSWEVKIVDLGINEYSAGLGYYLSIGRFWQLLIGVLVFIVANEFRLHQNSILGKIAFFGMVLLLFNPINNEIWSSLFICVITAILLAAPLSPFQSKSGIRFQRILSFLGYRSYSIYLIHLPVIVILSQNFAFLSLKTYAEFILRITSLAIIFLASHIMYEKVECRFRMSEGTVNFSSVKQRTSIFVLFAISIVFFFFGTSENYFSLNQNISKPNRQTFIGDNCKGNSPNAIPCFRDNKESLGTLVLLGDSHAEHFSQTLADATHNSKFKYYGVGFCAPSLEPYPRIREGCLEFSVRAKRFIDETKPDILLISVFITSSQMGESVAKYISKLDQSAKQIVVLNNTPVFPDSETFFVDRPIIYGKKEFKKSFHVSQMDKVMRNISLEFTADIRKYGIKTIDLWSVYCNYNLCTRKMNDNWLFFDTHHLSQKGAELLGPLFFRLIQNVDS